MADRHNTNGNTAATENEVAAAVVSGSTGSGPRFRPKPGSVFPVKRKLVQTRMKDAFLRLLRSGSAGNAVSDQRRAYKISRVLPDDSPPIDPPNGQN